MDLPWWRGGTIECGTIGLLTPPSFLQSTFFFFLQTASINLCFPPTILISSSLPHIVVTYCFPNRNIHRRLACILHICFFQFVTFRYLQCLLGCIPWALIKGNRGGFLENSWRILIKLARRRIWPDGECCVLEVLFSGLAAHIDICVSLLRWTQHSDWTGYRVTQQVRPQCV